MATLGARVTRTFQHPTVVRQALAHGQPEANVPYPSVDALQQALTRDHFRYARDAKKAAGRALGTIVEIIAFYAIKAWGLERYTAIERRLPEYGNWF